MAVLDQRAVTVEGMLAKIRVSLTNGSMTMEELDNGDPDARTLASLICDLERLAG